MQRAVESDICIIGSGISAAMVAEELARTTRASIVVVEAGDDAPPLAERAAHRRRFLDYGEDPWPDDHLDGYDVEGPLQSRSMLVGGLAMHWGGVTPRFTPEDFRLKSIYGVGDDWPISYDDLEPYYQRAEELIGVAGESGPTTLDPRSRPFPMPPLPLTYNLGLLKNWATAAGIATWSQPSAKNSVVYGGRAACCRNDTCTPVCPVGAKYSPDFTWNALRQAGRIRLVMRTLIRRFVLDRATGRISHAVAVDRDRPDDPVEFHARTFVVAGGYVWSAHLLLLSAQPGAESGVANRSGRLPHGQRPFDQRDRRLGTHSRPREPVRCRGADVCERGLRQRDADLLRAGAADGRGGGSGLVDVRRGRVRGGRHLAHGDRHLRRALAIHQDVEGVGPRPLERHVEREHRAGLDLGDARRRLAELDLPVAAQDLPPVAVLERDHDLVIADLGAASLQPQHQVQPRMHRGEPLDPDPLEDAQHGQLARLVDQRVVADQGEVDDHASVTRTELMTSPCLIW